MHEQELRAILEMQTRLISGPLETTTVSRGLLSGLRDLLPGFRFNFLDTACASFTKSVPVYHQTEKVAQLNVSGEKPLSPLQEKILQLVLAFAGPMLGHARAHEEVTKESLVDTLTQLPNRRAYNYQLEIQSKRSFVLALLDLDGFKAINDTKGHAAGDETLRSVAMCLRSELRELDTLYRIGGDEFAIIFTGQELPGLLHVTTIIDRLRKSVEALSIGVSFSVGSLHYPKGEDMATFCDRVDKILYADKMRRKARRTGSWLP